MFVKLPFLAGLREYHSIKHIHIAPLLNLFEIFLACLSKQLI